MDTARQLAAICGCPVLGLHCAETRCGTTRYGRAVKPDTQNEILHIRVTKDVRDQIVARSKDEQRTVTDMVRVLLGYALSEMPYYRLPTKNFGVTTKASNTDVTVE